MITNNLVKKFLKHIGFGEQQEAECMLKENRDLILEFGDLEDCAGRRFESITAFQYSLWALDWHMWKMLENYLSADQKVHQIKSIYDSKWSKVYGNVVCWKNLIDCLDELYGQIEKLDKLQKEEYWIKIGNYQKMLPAHVIQEYSRRDRSFFPCPDFCELFLPRREIADLTWSQGWDIDNWLIQIKNNRAWLRGEGIGASAQSEPIIADYEVYLKNYYKYDCYALNSLFVKRQGQREQIENAIVDTKNYLKLLAESSSSSSNFSLPTPADINELGNNFTQCSMYDTKDNGKSFFKFSFNQQNTAHIQWHSLNTFAYNKAQSKKILRVNYPVACLLM